MAETKIYRGYHANHPNIEYAKLGIIVPGDEQGNVTPADHNKGGVSAISQYSSFTYDLGVAEFHARKAGPGGVILELTIGSPMPGEEWS